MTHAYRGGTTVRAAIAAILAGTLYTQHASAQAQEQEEVLQEVSITGSRIVRRDLEASSPIVTVEAQALEEKGTLAVETVLNDLPQFVPANTQFITGDVQPGPMSTPGSATLNLRGLGSNRTLVLIDGRRAQPANASLVVDINSIPSSAIASVEIISGGASAVYGADAMGGVTNFKLRDNFQGATVQARGGMTEYGDGEEYSINTLLGVSLGSQGNAMLGVEWQQRESALVNKRPFFAAALTDPTVAGRVESRILRPSYEVITTRNQMGGIITGNAPSSAAVNALFPERTTNITATDLFYFNHDNSIFMRQYGGIGFNETIGDGHYKLQPGSTPGGTLAENEHDPLLSSPMERYSVFGRAKYNFGDVTGFSQVMLVSTNVFNDRNHPPSTYASYAAAIPYGSQIYAPSRNPVTNETLPEYRAGGKLGLNCPATGGCTNSQAFPVPAELASLLNSRGANRTTNTAFPQPIYDSVTGQPLIVAGVDSPWRLSYAAPWLPTRATINDTQLYQALAGFSGKLGLGDWTWEAYASHGETHTTSSYEGYVSMALYRMVMQSPNYGRGFSTVDASGNNIIGLGLGNKVATCTTGLPVFEEFTPSQDCIDAITINATDRTDLTQEVVEANFQGGLYELPAGEIRAALGLSYRRNEFTFTPDYSRDIDNVFDIPAGAASATRVGGETNLREVYGELLVPLLRDKPFARTLELELGARRSNYNTAAGNVNTYKALFSWSPVDFVRMRGGYQLANRAPNVNELFLGASSIVGGAPDDPCAATGVTVPWGNVASNPDRAQVQALCSALINSPTSEYDVDPNAFAGTTGGIAFNIQKGNPNLDSEKGETYTIGLVMRSPFESPLASNISAAIDYYEATVSNAISTISATTTYDLCFNRDGSSNPNYSLDDPSGMCRNIERDPATGRPARTATPYTNLGTLKTSGVDLNLNWRAGLADMGLSSVPGALSLNVSLNYLLGFEAQDFPTQRSQELKGTASRGGLFDYVTVTTLRYTAGGGNIALNWRHTPQIDNAAKVTNPTTTQQGAAAYNRFNLSGGYNFTDNFSISGGVENLFDKDPPIYGATPTSSGAGSTLSSVYDTLGRRYYLTARMTF